jgi:TRAP-type mannitol/chloroaromatic compound transport system permease large subunit
VVLVLYGMIARQPVGQLWLAGVFPGLMMAGLFILYIVVRCRCSRTSARRCRRRSATCRWREKLRLLRAGMLPLFIFFSMTGLFLLGITSLVESSAVGALAATLAAISSGG